MFTFGSDSSTLGTERGPLLSVKSFLNSAASMFDMYDPSCTSMNSLELYMGIRKVINCLAFALVIMLGILIDSMFLLISCFVVSFS